MTLTDRPRKSPTRTRSFRKRLVQCETAWIRHWPLSRGRWLFTRLHDALYKCKALQPAWTTVYPSVEMLLDSRDYIAQAVILEGTYEPCVLRALESNLRHGATFLDIGANAGIFSLIGSRLVGNSGKVLSFEPNPNVAAVMKQNVSRNDIHNVTLQQIALSDHDSCVSLFLSPVHNTGKSSLASNNALGGSQVPVQTRVLDHCLEELGIRRVEVIKLDVEGAELSVLRGAVAILTSCHPTVVTEIIPQQLAAFGNHPNEVFSLFTALGYRYEWLDRTNVAFIPNL